MMDDRARLARAPWHRLSSRPVYANPWIRVREDVVEMPNGRTTLYGVVECAGAVGVLPFLDADRVVLVGQYRYVAGRFVWEMPTGGIRPGESETDAAQRELREEAGYRAQRLTKLCAFHSSKSVVDETAHIYLGDELEAERTEAERTEFLEVRVFPFDQVLQMVEGDEIKDAMTVIAVLHAARRRGR